MGKWNEGYVTDIGYTHGYYRELSPILQRFALLTAGFAPPDSGSYLELGSGQGLSACIHAAATNYEIWATDFNPSQALNARHLLQAAAIDAQILDQSFSELQERCDLPKFDHIVAHGVWTWVSDANRASIVEILRRHLAIGGAAYLSYNAMPGWSSALALRKLMCIHAELAGAPADGISSQVAVAMEYAKQLEQTGSLYFKTHPEVVDRLNRLDGQERHYIAHEYFNRDWLPMHFADLVSWLTPAKLEFATSANLLDQIDVLNFTTEAQALLINTKHTVLRETMRDYYVNQLFRRDLYLRGHRRLTALEQFELLESSRIALHTASEDVPNQLIGPLGEVSLQEAVYKPLIEALAQDGYRPKRLSELRAVLPMLTMPQLLEAVKIMVGLGHIHPAQDEIVAEAVRPRTTRLNREICSRARVSGDIMFLASPVLGAGIMVSRIEQLFLLVRAETHGSPEEWARVTWGILEQQGFRIQKEERRLATAEENLAELERQATNFSEKRLPVMLALGIA